jgi:hypothetical protein
MAHEIIMDGAPQPPSAVTDIGPAARPWLRVHRLPNADTLVISSAGATRDGTPLLGNLGLVPWGTSALLRAGAARVEIVWHARSEVGAADGATCCRMCFGSIAAGEPALRCACAVLLHEECDKVRITCPGCGLPNEGNPG